jgi:hypothetical protein
MVTDPIIQFDEGNSLEYARYIKIFDFPLGSPAQNLEPLGNRKLVNGIIISDFSSSSSLLGFNHPLSFLHKTILSNDIWIKEDGDWNFLSIPTIFQKYFISPQIVGIDGLINKRIQFFKDQKFIHIKRMGFIFEYEHGYEFLNKNFFYTLSTIDDGFRAFIPLSVNSEDLNSFIHLLKKLDHVHS